MNFHSKIENGMCDTSREMKSFQKKDKQRNAESEFNLKKKIIFFQIFLQPTKHLSLHPVSIYIFDFLFLFFFHFRLLFNIFSPSTCICFLILTPRLNEKKISI